MAVTVDLYDHTTLKTQNGTWPASDSYVVTLYTTLPFNASATTKTAAESGATQLSTANGYTQNTKALTGVSIAAITTNDSRFSFDPVIWDATGSGIAAAFALLWSDTQTNDPPMARINFGGTVTAPAGTQFRIAPQAGGFIVLTNAA